MAVFVLAKNKQPLMPCSEKRARLLLDRGKAVVHRRMPFTIRLKDRTEGAAQPVHLKLDPGSKATGLALVREAQDHQHVLFLGEIEHRGAQIRKKLQQRANFRRRRRSANLRYRAPRFLNRTKPKGWLAPSLKHRVVTVASWVSRLQRLIPVTAVTQELVRFDTQLLENPDISGIEYQQGTLHGYEIREYVFEKWGRACVYCDAKDVPLNLDHIDPKANGGSNRPSNLVPSCVLCNQKKDRQDIRQFLAQEPQRLARILAGAKRPLRDASAVNATRFALLNRLKETGLPVECATGGRTKFNRHRLGVPKSHALDAACAGTFGTLSGWEAPVLTIRCSGRGSYQRTRLTRFGFPRGYLMRNKQAFGFATGDLVQATVPSGKKAGTYCGRVAIRARGYFNIQTSNGLVKDVPSRYCTQLQRGDGYGYFFQSGLGGQDQDPTFLPTLDVA